MPEKNLLTHHLSPEWGQSLYDTTELQWFSILWYYRDLALSIDGKTESRRNAWKNRLLLSQKPDIVVFCDAINALVGITDYTMVVAIWKILKLYESWVLSINDLLNSPINKYFLNNRRSAYLQTGLVLARVRSTF
jgi:hypothetical protein